MHLQRVLLNNGSAIVTCLQGMWCMRMVEFVVSQLVQCLLRYSACIDAEEAASACSTAYSRTQ
eukprot:205636-Amphidinium_carterae.1